MHKKLEKLKQSKERDEAKARELLRKSSEKAQQISKLLRNADTRRKVLAGAWALYRAEKSTGFEEDMLRDFDKFWLSRDDDRRLFGLPLLSDEEKERREIAYGKPGRKKAAEETETSLSDDTVADAA